MDSPTIAAIASPPGSGGIGIIKISGPDAIGIASRTFRPSHNGNNKDGCQGQSSTIKLVSHRIYYGHIVDPDKRVILDEVLLLVMKAPLSYTREDVVEIQTHAGPAVMRSIMTLIIHQGAQVAEPGEFTRRAFLNGRIDLTQAEAVIDLIHAKTDTAYRSAANQVAGKLGEIVDRVRGRLIDVLVQLEANIDFPQDMTEMGADTRMSDDLQADVVDPIEKLIRNYQDAHLFRDGLDIAIIGRPNVGKSSLLNCLLEKERAIVNPIPGTTRDSIDCTFQVKGIPVNITDTAGIHITDDPVEKLGISKTLECIEEADLILFVLDASEPIRHSDFQAYQQCHEKTVVYVINKTDLVPHATDVEGFLPKDWKGGARVPVSALLGTGVELLKETIFSTVADNPQGLIFDSIIPNLRHFEALEKCLQNVKDIAIGIEEKTPAELIAIDARESLNRLDDILGKRTSDDILDQIFSRFCIGK